MDKLRVLLQQLRAPPSVIRVIRLSAEQAAGEIAEPCLLIRHQIVIGGLGRLREPLARIVLRGVIPAERKIRRTKLLLGDGERDQELVVQIDRALLLRLVSTRHIQRVIVLPAALQILRPGQSVFGHPAEALEHALGENEIHIVDPVPLTPDVRDLGDSELVKQALVVHLMDNALDVRQTDLKGMMFFLITAEQRRQLLRHQPLAIELQHLDVQPILDAAIGAHRIRRTVIRHGDDRHIPHQRFRIVDDNDTFGIQKVLALDPIAVGEHQCVIGIELRELTPADLHAEHHVLPELFVNVLADEGEPVRSAHACGALEGDIVFQLETNVELHALRAKECLRLFLQLQHLTDRLAVEDAGEVDVHEYIVQALFVPKIGCVSAHQLARMIEDRAVILHRPLDQILPVVICERRALVVHQQAQRRDLRNDILVCHSTTLLSGFCASKTGFQNI